MAEFIVQVIAEFIAWIISSWVIMITEGAVASQHHIYQIGFTETALILFAVGTAVAYITRRVKEISNA